jgi:hypothetical protein
MTSSDEAFSVLSKWFEDGQPMKLMLKGDGFRMSFAGRIIGISGTEVEFLPDEPNACEGECRLDLAKCRFEYGDSREAPPDSISRLKLASILTAVRPDGVIFLFAEVRA